MASICAISSGRRPSLRSASCASACARLAFGFAHGGALLFGFQREQPGSGGDPAAALDRHALDPTGFGRAEPQVLALGIALPRLSGFAAGRGKRSEEQEEAALHDLTSWGTADEAMEQGLDVSVQDGSRVERLVAEGGENRPPDRHQQDGSDHQPRHGVAVLRAKLAALDAAPVQAGDQPQAAVQDVVLVEPGEIREAVNLADDQAGQHDDA